MVRAIALMVACLSAAAYDQTPVGSEFKWLPLS